MKSAAGTEQEEFWRSHFCEDYIARNQGEDIVAANLNIFAQALRRAEPIASCIELGTNIGLNLKALKLLCPGIVCDGVEINPVAAA